MFSSAIFVLATIIIVSENAQKLIHNNLTQRINLEYNTSISQNKFINMQKINPDFYLWLKFSTLSTPVVKSSDNQKYLSTAFDGTESKYGTIFADYRNSRLGGSESIVLYGHNFSKTGEMFGIIEKFLDINHLSQNPYIELEFQNENRKYLISNIFYADADIDSTDHFPYNDLPFSNDTTAKQTLISEIERRSTLKLNESLSPDDSLLILSTCGYNYLTERIVVVAKLIDEKTEISPKYMEVKNPFQTQKWKSLYE